MPTDSRGRLAAEPFTYQVTKDGAIRIAHEGKVVATLVGKPAARLATLLATAEPDQVQLALAKATGNFKRGNERRSDHDRR
jgi:hypothetical protein